MKGFSASWCCAAVLLAAVAEAETIQWSCDPSSVNRESDGAPMGAGFQFELGVFSPGFTPTMANRSQWLDHWHVAQTTNYESGNGRFGSEFRVEGNASPFVVDAEAWILGRRNDATGSEWVIFRAASWVWPLADPLAPEPLEWNTADAGIVLAGEVNGSGSPFLMKSERIRDYGQWQASELAGESLIATDQDADFDGVANIVEFFCGTDPADAASRPAVAWSFAGPGGPFLRVEYPADPGSLAVASVEASDDLSGWSASGVALEWSAGMLVATDSVAAGPGVRRFLRLRVELP
ncbi:hypothetical protein [Haloferula sp. A504]|uniref:hypothetical protein n=1 Tax=Haloferula sp. A504 TaxID=3373601 RepID=UPI0031BE9031|nr:hypothetical protein [Verrucomicrobiaceae bacterium E54]